MGVKRLVGSRKLNLGAFAARRESEAVALPTVHEETAGTKVNAVMPAKAGIQ
jgi:hypothetical protein